MSLFMIKSVLSRRVYEFDTPTVAATVVDDGYYNGFPFPYQLSNGTIISIYKKSGDHASKGPMTIARSTNGGTSWTESQITVGVTAIECAALSVGILSSGRIVIGYQDDIAYTSLKFAYSDDNGVTWTASASTLTNGTGLSFSPVKMRILPSGKILCGYYTGYGALEDAEIGFVTSTDNGATWAFGPTIYNDHDDSVFGMSKGYEFGFEIVTNTGTDATCNLLALVRHASAGVYMHYKSVDGGTTWTTDTVTEDAPGSYNRHYLYNLGSASNQAPCDIVVHLGNVYVVTGYRDATNGYELRYITASVANALENNFYNWSAVTTVLTTAINDVHFGYPICFTDWQGELWCQYYDVSAVAQNGNGSPRCLIKQVKIAEEA